tara:strand:+ start:591 stop:812 length:222 start_codon:yes stop_codon:yes gene_type:complete
MSQDYEKSKTKKPKRLSIADLARIKGKIASSLQSRMARTENKPESFIGKYNRRYYLRDQLISWYDEQYGESKK